jgi:hypothetical protein
MASSSSEEEMVRFLLLDAGGAAFDLAGDLADESPESDEGRGREDVEGWAIPDESINPTAEQKCGETKCRQGTFVYRQALKIGWLDVYFNTSPV